MEFAPIDLEIEDDLSAWRLNVSGKAEGSAELLSGPTAILSGVAKKAGGM